MRKVLKLLIVGFLIGVAAPAAAETNVVVSGGDDTKVTYTEGSNDRTVAFGDQSATIDQSNNQKQLTQQTAEGGDAKQTNNGPAVAPVNANVSPAANVAAPVQTGPVEVLTTKTNTIEQKQSYEDNSTNQRNDTTTTTDIDRSFNRSADVDNSVVVADSPTIVLDSKAARRPAPSSGVIVLGLPRTGVAFDLTGEAKTLPRTGLPVGSFLAVGLSLIAAGVALHRAGRRPMGISPSLA